MTNYYELIGVAKNADQTTIKARYRELCKTYHPDVGGNQQAMAQLNEAYNVLSRPLERAAYDRKLAQQQAAARAAAEARRTATVQQWQRNAPPKTQPQPFQNAYQAAKPTKKRSRFWSFMVWGTILYSLAGLAVIFYFTTKPSTAAETTTDAPQTTSLQQEAANASANVPDTPSSLSISESDNSSTDIQSATTTPQENTTQPTEDDTTPTTTDTQSTNQNENQPTSENTHKHAGWRRFLNF